MGVTCSSGENLCAWGKRCGDCRLRGASGEGSMVHNDGFDHSTLAMGVDRQEHGVRCLRILN